MKYFLFKLLGVVSIGAGGFIIGYCKGVSIPVILGSVSCFFFGQVFYDLAFKHKEDE